LYSLAFSKESDDALLQSLSSQASGFARVVSEARELGPVFAEIFQSVKQPQTLAVKAGGFTVDKSVRQLTVVAQSEGGKPVELRSPGGKDFNQQGELGKNGWIRIANPEAGAWQIQGARADHHVFVETEVALEVKLPSHVQEGQQPVRLEAGLVHAGVNLIDPEILDGLHLDVRIDAMEAGGFASQPLALADRGEGNAEAAGDGIYSVNLPVMKPGVYRLEVNARTKKNLNRQITRMLHVEVHSNKDFASSVPTSAAALPEPTPAMEPVKAGQVMLRILGLNAGLILFIVAWVVVRSRRASGNRRRG
jgi:hypothetical protein